MRTLYFDPVQKKHAFTLLELLVVIAIISLLAALLFPLFASARDKARQATCASNFKQQSLAIFLYQSDADERMPDFYHGDGSWISPPAVVSGQIYRDYLKSTQVYACPSDPATEEQRATLWLAPPTTPQQRLFNLSIKNDFGLNYLYLSSIYYDNKGWFFSRPVVASAIRKPSETLLAVDSIWARDAAGYPTGGGASEVEPPCRFYADGQDSWPAEPSGTTRFAWGGWLPSRPLDWLLYGGVWPWHGERASVAFCDGHIKAMTIGQLSHGCNVQDSWGGRIVDREAYLWDLE